MSRQMTAAPYSAGEAHHAVEARAGRFAVLEVRRVEDGAAADVLQPGLEHRGLGRVEHERHARLGGEPRRRSRPCRPRRRVRRSRRTRRARARPRGPGPWPCCTHVSQSAASIASRNFFEPFAFVRSPMIRNEVSCSNGWRASRSTTRRLEDGARCAGVEVAAALDDRREVIGRGATAAADDAHAELGDEALVVVGELARA